MKRDILYFLAQTKANFKNAHALRSSFWIGVFGMMLNNLSFFVIWLLFMHATGPINGWTGMDVFGMLGVAMFCFGVCNSFFFGTRDLPELVVRGSFDNVLLAPVNSFLKLSGSSFSVASFGDLMLGFLIAIFYGFYLKFSLYLWLVYIISVIFGCIIFIAIRLLCSLVVFYVHDGEVVATSLFEIFLRPGLYPGGIFPSKMKLFFMTVIPTLVTSAVPIDAIKGSSSYFLILGFTVTLFWVVATLIIYKLSVKRYESGNFLR